MEGSKLAAGGSAGGGLGAALVYLADRLGAHLTPEDGALIAVGAVAVFAFVAHNGVRGVLHIFWSGAGDTPTPPPEGA